jgi:hypothetical protein
MQRTAYGFPRRPLLDSSWIELSRRVDRGCPAPVLPGIGPGSTEETLRLLEYLFCRPFDRPLIQCASPAAGIRKTSNQVKNIWEMVS